MICIMTMKTKRTRLHRNGKPNTRKHKHKHVHKHKHTTDKLINTRNEPCSKGNMSVCCPHMTPDEKGRYAATTKKTDSIMNELKYRGRVYSLRTCCPMCAEQMNSLSQKDPDAFDRLYKVNHANNSEMLLLANRHTGKYVQKCFLVR
jgi:hypothetical protein